MNDFDEDLATFILRLCCLLPRLPARKIEEGYKYIRSHLSEVEPEATHQKVLQNLNYVKKNWEENPLRPLQDVWIDGHHIAATSGQESWTAEC